MTVTVVGIGADGWDGLTPRAIRAISASKVILGSVRQLALVGVARVPALVGVQVGAAGVDHAAAVDVAVG